ncbi:hypothetical protein SAMN02745116_01162 [Pilibacter termitis]|uniref:Vitamin B12 dependent methionine synthase, activation domain n=1 Tax=Pilibacter termitis TaxID=263852 RepID=A0A1T4MPY4_9ENTE|nr:methionine synthase [Pilibacter termitis]SJZ68876.1 hypothetical protein SAMN02745116_01162 [Pilibacter termitis]
MPNPILPLKKSEVLRYLGYRRKQELTAEVEAIVEELMIEVQKVSKPRYLYQIFDCLPDDEKREIKIGGSNLILRGQHIYNHLRRAKKVALLGATLGIEAERQTRKYEITDMTKAFVFDACCVEMIEQVCDLAEVEIDDDVGENWTLNRRFSPGYGDLPLDVQPEFLASISANRKLGLTLTATNLMVPRKSVTAIIGLFDDKTIARPRRREPDDLSIELVEKLSLNVEKN